MTVVEGHGGILRLRVPAHETVPGARVRIGSAKASTPLLTLSSVPPVLNDGGAIAVDGRGRVVLGPDHEPPGPDDRDPGEELLLLTAPQ